MRKQELKARIKQEFEAATPNLSSKIIESCKKASVEEVAVMEKAPKKPNFSVLFKRLSLCAACLLIFVVGISAFVFIKNSQGDNTPTVDTSIYLDVNPSVEIQLDGDGKVIDCIALNKDAEGVIKDLNLSGNNVNDAIKSVIGSMHQNGYITKESSSILVSVSAKDDEKSDTLLTDITKNINEVFVDTEIKCSIITQAVTVSEELQKRAEENGVSVGKMHLVDKMIEELGDVDEDDVQSFINMSIGELDKILETIVPPSEEPPKEDPPIDNPPNDDNPPGEEPPIDNPPSDNPPSDDPPSEEPPSGNTENLHELVILVAGAKGINVNDIEKSSFTPWLSGENGQAKLVHVVEIKLIGNGETFVYVLDFETNEIIKELSYTGEGPFWKHMIVL